MSETDSFIDEVSEEVRRDRLFGFFRKWGWLIALVLALIVGGAAFNEWRKAREEAARQEAGDALAQALSSADPAAQVAALETLSPEDPGQATLAELGRAGALLIDDREDDAVAALDGIAARTDIPQIYTDLAVLKAAMIRLDKGDSLTELDPLTEAGRPFRLLALELRAQRHIRDGDTGAALEDLAIILEDAETSRELRVRAEFLTTSLGGELPGRASLLPTGGNG